MFHPKVVGSLLLGESTGLSEKMSEGKSGSLFYWSRDGQFMLKTIGKDECDCLRGYAQHYLAHIRSNPVSNAVITLSPVP